MPKQVVLARFEAVVTRFGPQIDVKWLNNGSFFTKIRSKGVKTPFYIRWDAQRKSFCRLFGGYVTRFGSPAVMCCPFVLGVQSYRGNGGNLRADLKCRFGETISQECARKTILKYSEPNGLHGAHTTFSVADSRTWGWSPTVSNFVKGVFTGWFRGGGYSPHGCVKTHGHMYCGTVLQTLGKPITETNYVLRGGWGEKATTRLEYLYPSILPACSMMYTGLCVAMGATTVMPLFYFAARQVVY